MDKIRFIDCNYPGVIYVGTQRAFDYLASDGGCPSIVSNSFTGEELPLSEDEDGYGVSASWCVQDVPAFWEYADNARCVPHPYAYTCPWE